MLHGNVIDQLHENDGLADAGAAEQADLPAAGIRSQEINDFDPRFESLDFRLLIDEFRRGTVNGVGFLGVDRTLFIYGLPDDVENASQRFFSDRYRDTRAGVHRVRAANQALRGVHRNATDGIFTQVLRHFDNEIPLHVADRGIADLERIVNWRQRAVGKFDVDDRSQNLGDLPHIHLNFSSVQFLTSKLPPCRRSPLARA